MYVTVTWARGGGTHNTHPDWQIDRLTSTIVFFLSQLVKGQKNRPAFGRFGKDFENIVFSGRGRGATRNLCYNTVPGHTVPRWNGCWIPYGVSESSRNTSLFRFHRYDVSKISSQKFLWWLLNFSKTTQSRFVIVQNKLDIIIMLPGPRG